MGRMLLIWTMKDLRDVVERCINNKFDCIIFVEGNRGLGKSTFAFKLLNGLNLPIPFNPKRDIVYTREDTLKHLATKKGGAIFSDELINVAYNRDFYEDEQKVMLKALNMYRDSCNVFIGCIPKFIELDKQIQRLCKIRITIIRRGVALIQTQMHSIYSQDSWDTKNNQKIELAWASKGAKNPRYGQLTTIRGILRFGDLSSGQREEYEKIKEEKRGRVFANYQDETLLGNPEKLFYTRLVDLIKKGAMSPETFETFAKIEGKKSDEMRRKVNLMLKEQGEERRWKDFVVSEKQKNKRDRLGFRIGVQDSGVPLPVPEQVSPGDNDKQQEGGEEQEDVFGFVQ